jgi:hypothetical protein
MPETRVTAPKVQETDQDSERDRTFWFRWAIPGFVWLGSVLYLWSIHLTFLSIFDSINFAFSLNHFNTFLHMPQPPGYPGFVLIARVFNLVLHSATDTFFAVGVVASLVSCLLSSKAAEAMSSARAGIAASVLILLNPAALSSILTSPVRLFLGLFSVAVACLAWRMWNRPAETWSLYAAWAVLGIGSSFRPELALVLLPVVAIATLRSRHSVLRISSALVLFGTLIFLWIYFAARPGGSIATYFDYLKLYSADQAAGAIEVNSRGGTNPFWHMVLKATAWTFVGVLAWIWALPYALWRGRFFGKSVGTFLLLWFPPIYVFQCFVHIAQPGHALAAIAALCVLGGIVLASIRNRWLFLIGLVVASAVNLVLFQYPVIKDVDEGTPAWLSETNNRINPGMNELLAVNRDPGAYFMVKSGPFSWRTLRFYFPESPLLVLDPGLSATCSSCPTYFRGAGYVPEDVVGTIYIPACGRLIWDIGSSVPAELQRAVNQTVSGPIPVIDGKPGLIFDLPGMHFESRSEGFCNDNQPSGSVQGLPILVRSLKNTAIYW